MLSVMPLTAFIRNVKLHRYFGLPKNSLVRYYCTETLGEFNEQSNTPKDLEKYIVFNLCMLHKNHQPFMIEKNSIFVHVYR